MTGTRENLEVYGSILPSSWLRIVTNLVEIRVKGHLYEISEVNDEVLENRQGYHMSEEGYRKTLDSVLAVAGVDLVDEVVVYLKEYIREHEERPTNNDVRRKARSLVSKAGYPADEYLNAA